MAYGLLFCLVKLEMKFESEAISPVPCCATL